MFVLFNVFPLNVEHSFRNTWSFNWQDEKRSFSVIYDTCRRSIIDICFLETALTTALEVERRWDLHYCKFVTLPLILSALQESPHRSCHSKVDVCVTIWLYCAAHIASTPEFHSFTRVGLQFWYLTTSRFLNSSPPGALSALLSRWGNHGNAEPLLLPYPVPVHHTCYNYITSSKQYSLWTYFTSTHLPKNITDMDFLTYILNIMFVARNYHSAICQM